MKNIAPIIIALLPVVLSAQPSLTNTDLDGLTATAKSNLETLGMQSDETLMPDLTLFPAVLPRTQGRIANTGANTPFKCVALSTGDSLAINTMGISFGIKVTGYGGNADSGYWTPAGSYTYYDSTTLNGTPDPEMAPFGMYVILQPGATLTFDTSRSKFSRTFSVFYTSYSSGGTFSVTQDTGSGYGAIDASLTDIDTYSATIEPGIASWDFGTSLKRAIRITNSDGSDPVCIWGVTATDRYTTAGATKGGFDLYNFGSSGATVEQLLMEDSGGSNRTDFFEDLADELDVDVVMFKCNDVGADLETNLPLLLDAINAGLGAEDYQHADPFLISNHPSSSHNAPDLTDADKFLMATAIERNGTFFHSKRIFRNHDLLTGLGLTMDGTHLGTGKYIESKVMADMIEDALLAVNSGQYYSGIDTDGNVSLDSCKVPTGGLNGTSIYRRELCENGTWLVEKKDYTWFTDAWDLENNRGIIAMNSAGYGKSSANKPDSRTLSAALEILGHQNRDETVLRVAGQNKTDDDFIFEVTKDAAFWSEGTVIFGVSENQGVYAVLPEFADDAAADADGDLPSGGLYKVTGDRTVYQKP